MTRINLTLLVGIGLVVAGLIANGVVSAQSASTTSGQDWEMYSGTIAGAAAGGASISAGQTAYGDLFLYNRVSGKAYKYFPSCQTNGADSPEGCFFAIPVVDARAGFQVHVSPTSRGGGTGQ